MLTRMRSFTHEQTKGQLYFRILPSSIKVTKQFKDNLNTIWVLYLEKGMQILGKTSQFQVSMLGDEYIFNPGKHKLDFQIASEKNFNYTWSLYSVDELGYEQRVVASVFSIKDYYLKNQKENSKSGHDLEVKLNNLTLNFKLFIQNSIANLIQVSSVETTEQLTKSPTANSKKSDINGVLKQKNKDKPAISQIIQVQKQKQVEEIVKPKSQIVVNQNEPHIEKKKEKKKPPSPKVPKIQEQEQEESHGSGPKNPNDSKLSLEIQNISLQPIDEDKQKQDSATPLHAKFHKPGFIQKAFSQALNKQEEIVQNQQQNHEQANNNAINSQNKQQQMNFSTPQPENEPKKNINELKSSKLMKSSLKIDTPPSNAKNNLKKIIITVLLIILIAGIIGSLIQKQKKNQQDEFPKKNKKIKAKIPKQGKN